MGPCSKWIALSFVVVATACQAEDSTRSTPDPRIEEAAVEHGIPVPVLEAAAVVPGLDPRDTASALATCARGVGAAGEDFADWTPALDCMADLQDEIDVHLNGFGGVQARANEISWDDDEVTLTFPILKDSTEGTANCASGSFCFYDGSSYNGKRLSFRYTVGSARFSTYGMRDKVSSWHNHSGALRRIYNEHWRGWDDYILWVMWGSPGAPTRSSYVGSSNTNKADYFGR